MRTYSNRAIMALTWVLVCTLGVLGTTSCRNKDKDKKKAGMTVSVLDASKPFGWTGTFKSTATVNEVAYEFPAAYFPKRTEDGAWALTPSLNPKKAITLQSGNTWPSPSVPHNNGYAKFGLAYVKDGAIVKDKNGKEIRADISSASMDSFPYSESEGAFSVFVINGKVYTYASIHEVTKLSGGGRELLSSLPAEMADDTAPAGTKLLAVYNGDFTNNAKEPELKDGRLQAKFAVTNDGNMPVQWGWFSGANLVKKVDLSLLAGSEFEPTIDTETGTFRLRIEGTNVYRWGTHEDPRAPGNEGDGDVRLTIGTADVSGVVTPFYRLFLRPELLTDREKQRFAVTGSWPQSQVPEGVRKVDWYPRFVEPKSMMGSIEWDKFHTVVLTVMDNFGIKDHDVQWAEGNVFLKLGSRTLIRFMVTGKGHVVPGSVPDNSEVSELVLGSPLNIPKQGNGTVKRTVLGKIGNTLVTLAYNADLKYEAGTMDSQNNFVPSQSGQEMFTGARGGIFVGKIDFGAQKCRIRYSYTNPSNQQVINIDLTVDVRVFDFKP